MKRLFKSEAYRSTGYGITSMLKIENYRTIIRLPTHKISAIAKIQAQTV
ncbi:MAG: hypothetical protein LBJ00_08140 [Planctomycetaceae bacterium]|nr:hypothetical protein [Planctomycetaceae bacterium]